MINREKVLKAFNSYVSNFDESEEMIRLKKLHTVKVASNCEKIGASLDLCDEKVDICWLIGMCHDIARFRQYEEYHTFKDADSIDHAKVGCEILFDEGLIDDFIDRSDLTNRILDLVYKAIRYHSEYRLPKDLDEEELLYCNIIRDADKVDIFRVAIEEPIGNLYLFTREDVLNSTITPAVLEAFYEHHAVKRELRKTMADISVAHVALAFELVFDKSKQLALEQGYLLRIIDEDYKNEETIRQVEGIKKELEEYLMG